MLQCEWVTQFVSRKNPNCNDYCAADVLNNWAPGTAEKLVEFYWNKNPEGKMANNGGKSWHELNEGEQVQEMWEAEKRQQGIRQMQNGLGSGDGLIGAIGGSPTPGSYFPSVTAAQAPDYTWLRQTMLIEAFKIRGNNDPFLLAQQMVEFVLSGKVPSAPSKDTKDIGAALSGVADSWANFPR